MNVPEVKMANGVKIPQVGLGLWQVKDEAIFAAMFDAAWDAGYRHFDSAQAYGNEQLLGSAWKKRAEKREDVWLTTKVRTETIALGKAAQSIPRSLENLQTAYVDLLLLHFPVPVARKKAWKVLEQAKQNGQAKSIGVSNYTIKHLGEMKLYATEMPAVNQVELHVFLQQPELVNYCHARGIAVEAYSPLAHGKRMHDKTVQAIADRHGKTYAQIMLRWGIENGLIILPKSTTPERVHENISLFDFEFYLDDLQSLAALDRHMRTCWNPTYVP